MNTEPAKNAQIKDEVQFFNFALGLTTEDHRQIRWDGDGVLILQGTKSSESLLWTEC